MYSLDIPHSTQNPSFFPVERSVAIHLFKIHISVKFHHIVVCVSTGSFEKITSTFFVCDLVIVTGDGDTNYKVLLSFPSSQPKFN